MQYSIILLYSSDQKECRNKSKQKATMNEEQSTIKRVLKLLFFAVMLPVVVPLPLVTIGFLAMNTWGPIIQPQEATINNNTSNTAASATTAHEDGIYYQQYFLISIGFALLTATIHFLPVLRILWKFTIEMAKDMQEKFTYQNPGCLTSWEKGTTYFALSMFLTYPAFAYLIFAYLFYIFCFYPQQQTFGCRDDWDLITEQQQNATNSNITDYDNSIRPPYDELYHGKPGDYCENPIYMNNNPFVSLFFVVLLVSGIDYTSFFQEQQWTCIRRTGLFTTYCACILSAAFTKVKQDTTVPQDHPVVVGYANKLWWAAWVALVAGVFLGAFGWYHKKQEMTMEQLQQINGIPITSTSISGDDDTITTDDTSSLVGGSSVTTSNDGIFRDDDSGNINSKGDVELVLPKSPMSLD